MQIQSLLSEKLVEYQENIIKEQLIRHGFDPEHPPRIEAIRIEGQTYDTFSAVTSKGLVFLCRIHDVKFEEREGELYFILDYDIEKNIE